MPNRVQNYLQMLVQITLQNSVQIDFADVRAAHCAVVRADVLQKNGSDADAFAEEMQRMGQILYVISTKLDTEKHGYDGLARLIPAAEGAGLIRFYPPNPPNSRSILRLQKNCAGAERRAVIRAECGTDYRVDWLRSKNRAVDTNLWYRCYGKTNKHG